MNRASPNYTGRLAPAAVAEVLGQSCGHWGTGAEYLMNTVQHLQARGIESIMRASLHYYNTEEEVERFVEAISRV